MIMWYLAVLMTALKLRSRIVWERLTEPVAPAALLVDNPTAALAQFPRNEAGVVVGRHRPSYIALTAAAFG